jgi:hypothetical protein
MQMFILLLPLVLDHSRSRVMSMASSRTITSGDQS